MKTKKIQTSNGHFEEFEVIDLNVKVGDHIWFDNAIDGSYHDYVEAEVTEVNPDHWWIYDDADKVLGEVSCTVVSGFDAGEHYKIDFRDVLTEKPLGFEEDEPEEDELSYEEALVSLISKLDTPIGRRKNDEDTNTCVRIIRAHLEATGVWDKYYGMEQMPFITK